jgi:Ca-activated chloride channel family protein
MMERVSNAGNGIYSVITSEEHADRYAEEDLLRAAHFVAQDMKIQVEFNQEHVLAYRLIGYENRAIADDDFRDDAVDAGEVGAGFQVTALYELVLAGGTIPQAPGAPELDDGEPVEGERTTTAADLVTVRVRYKELGATAEDPALEVAESLGADEITIGLDDSAGDPDLLYASAVAALAEILKGSPYAMPDELDAIEAILEAQADRDRDRAQLATLFARARPMLAAR